MSDKRTIKNALISVFHKDGLESIVKKLNELNVNIYSTGGTQKFIETQGLYRSVCDYVAGCTDRFALKECQKYGLLNEWTNSSYTNINRYRDSHLNMASAVYNLSCVSSYRKKRFSPMAL